MLGYLLEHLNLDFVALSWIKILVSDVMHHSKSASAHNADSLETLLSTCESDQTSTINLFDLPCLIVKDYAIV